jgi:hypothetical protein
MLHYCNGYTCIFQVYVLNVSSVLGMLHYYNGYTCIFQVYVLNVSSVLDICYKYFYLDVARIDLNVEYTCMLQAYVSFCRCFIRMLQVFAYVCNDFQVFLDIFARVSNACFKCFTCHALYVVIECYKNRSRRCT